LRAVIRFDQFDVILVATAALHVAAGLGVDREEAHRCAVLWRHVGERRAVGQRHFGNAFTVELDEFADATVRPQRFGDGQYEVGRSRAVRQYAGQFHTDNFRQQHVRRLAEHDGFGFNATNAPAEHAEAVDHGRVRVGADDRVRVDIGVATNFLGERAAGEILEVDLVHDAHAGRHHAEVRQRLLAPLQELVALLVALELELEVVLLGGLAVERVDLHRVVDD
jgi:hypothetical protein